MKKIVFAILASLIVLSVFTSCAAKSNQGYVSDARAAENGYDYEYPAEETGTDKNSDKKLIKRYSVTTETKEYDNTAAALNGAVSDFGGYFERFSESNARNNGERRLNATVRIPAAASDEFLSKLREISNVTSFEKNAEDVTGAYVDIEARLQTLEAEREGLLNMISSVDSASQYDFWYKLHETISEKEQDIAAYKAQLKNYDDLSSYSTFTIYMTEVKEYTEPEKEDYGVRVRNAFTESWERFAESFKDFTVSFIRAFPRLLTFAVVTCVIFVCVFFPIRAARKRRNKMLNK